MNILPRGGLGPRLYVPASLASSGSNGLSPMLKRAQSRLGCLKFCDFVIKIPVWSIQASNYNQSARLSVG